MAKAFSLASWNVENFKGKAGRVEKVVGFLKKQGAGGGPDVFALHEVVGRVVYRVLVDQMPGYQFHITEGRQTQEILVGVKRGLTAFFTQKVEFKSGNSYLRPGALLSLNIDGKDYSILFLHTKSSTKPIGLGIRDDMFYRAFRLKRRLDKAAGGSGKANFIFMGDLNTMGMRYPYGRKIDPLLEIKRLKGRASYSKMALLEKNYPATWWNGPKSSYPPADLDHVLASKQMVFKTFGQKNVAVRGWPEKTSEAEQLKWIEEYSDHGLLYLEVEKV